MCHGADYHLLGYYERSGQTIEADRQRKANDNLNKMRKLKLATNEIELNQGFDVKLILNKFSLIPNPTKSVIKISAIAVVVFVGVMIYLFE